MNAMKKLIPLIALIFLTGFQTPQGDLISRGDRADKLILKLGPPQIKTYVGLVQRGPDWVSQDIWTYKIGGTTYRFTIEGGVIVGEEFSNF